MPRQGEGEQISQNGPIETGENLVHGASGDTTLKHAQKVAPAPEGEKGAALEGMNASGGAAGGTNHGTNVGQNKPPQEK